MLQCGPWLMGGGDSLEFRRSGGRGRSGVGAGWSRGHLGLIPLLSWSGGGAGKPAWWSQAAAAATA
jgi:hypothetical protein